MSRLVVRPLVAGEESLFESMPDPLPQVRKIAYADGIATGGYRPERTWVALIGDRVVGRAAWVLPPGAVGRPWLERFELAVEGGDAGAAAAAGAGALGGQGASGGQGAPGGQGDPVEPDETGGRGEPVDPVEVGRRLLVAGHASLGGPTEYYAAAPPRWRTDPALADTMAAPLAAARRAGLVETGERLRYSWRGGELPPPDPGIRPAADRGEITARLDGRRPDLVTGRETALTVAGVDLTSDPLGWLTGPPGDWLVEADGPGIAGVAVDACYPLLAYLNAEGARRPMLAAVCRAALAAGAREVIADVDADRADVIADLEWCAFQLLRARVILRPAGG